MDEGFLFVFFFGFCAGCWNGTAGQKQRRSHIFYHYENASERAKSDTANMKMVGLEQPSMLSTGMVFLFGCGCGWRRYHLCNVWIVVLDCSDKTLELLDVAMYET